MNKRKVKFSQSKPQLVVISAPSGGGKTTITHELRDRNPDFVISVSATTRKPRPGEQDGVDYFFISEAEFMNKVKNNEFLEFEQVHGNYYGTPKEKVLELMRSGYTVLFDVDVNGALKIKEKFPEALLFFIHPPSKEELVKRLKNRKTDSPDEIEKRLKRLPEEFAKAPQFDFQIVNEDLNRTVAEIEKIIREKQKSTANVTH